MTWPIWFGDDDAPPTPYVDPGLTARLEINGTPWADTGSDLAAGDPTVLAGARVIWGRSTVVDQPDASTAAFTVAAVSGESGFLKSGLLDIGSRVDLYASGALAAGIGPNQITDPGFEARAVLTLDNGRTPGGDVRYNGGEQKIPGAIGIVTSPTASGSHAVAIRAPVFGQYPGFAALTSLLFLPAPTSTDRGAWDHIETLPGSGDTMWVSVSLRVPAGCQWWAWPYGIENCQPGARVMAAGRAASGSRTGIGTGDWQTYTALPTIVGASTVGWWPGVLIQWEPQAWQDLPAAQAWDETPGTWDDFGFAYVDDIGIQFAQKAPRRDVLMFTGRVTDIDAKMVGTPPILQVAVTASDPIAELGNTMVGDQPWAVETLAARASRIMALTGTGIPVQMDSPAATRSATYRDVDRQAAAGLIQELAASAGAVAWMATHATAADPYWFVEDPSTRRAGLYTMQMIDGFVVIVAASAAGPFTELSACRVLLDPTHWRKSVADVTTVVDLSWLTQGVDDKGKPMTTETHSTVQAAQAELTKYGYRRYGLTTQLAAKTDADQVALLIYARLAQPIWRVGGLTWDTRVGPHWANDETTLALDLLDGQLRLGHPLMVTDLPDWNPDGADHVPVYIEGGTYTFDAGRWRLDFNVSSAAGIGESGPWTSLDPAWTWAQMAPTMAWSDLVGVTGPVTT